MHCLHPVCAYMNCMYVLSVSPQERERMCKCEMFQNLKRLMLQDVTVSSNSTCILVIPFVKEGKSSGCTFS